MLALTLWHIADWRKALPSLAQIQPGALMLHGDSDTLAQHAQTVQQGLIKELGAAAPKEWWVEIAGDEGRGVSAKAREQLRQRGAVAAHNLGATRVVLNCEAAWKENLFGFQAEDAIEFVEMARDTARCPVYVSSQDCPGYHASFPWEAFDCADGWLPEIYAAPATGNPAPDSKQGRARLRLHQAKWAQYVSKGLLKPRSVVGYVQAHHVVARETMWVLDAHDEAAMWAFPERSDSEGLRAARAFTALERLGYVNHGRIARFQRDHGLTVDGLCGPHTFEAIGV